jgi:hypothetical protein
MRLRAPERLVRGAAQERRTRRPMHFPLPSRFLAAAWRALGGDEA